MKYKSLLQSSTAMMVIMIVVSRGSAADLAAPAPAPLFTQLPAVDGVNGKFEAFGAGTGLPRYRSPVLDASLLPNANAVSGDSRWRGGGGGAGAISAPLGANFGVQGEGMLASWNNNLVAGAGAHLFWRDPNRGLLGVYGSGSYFGVLNGIGVARAAAEGEAYFGRFTLEGMAGVETGRRNRTSSLFGGVTTAGVPYYGYTYYNVRTRFYDKASVAYYVTDNFKLSVGQIYTGGRVLASLGAEYLFPVSPGIAGSLFVDGHIGGGRTSGVRGGLKVYFGNADKPLIRRQREDDPPINLPLDLLTIANTRSTAIAVLPVPPAPVQPPPVCNFEGNIIPCNQHPL